MRRMLMTLLLACGATPPAELGDAPLETVTTDAGRAQVALWASPSPLVRGSSTIRLVVTDATNKPLDGVTIDVVPWMPAMGHGSSTVPVVSALGNGGYLVSEVVLVMPGTWELRMQLSGSVQDTLTANVTVQ